MSVSPRGGYWLEMLIFFVDEPEDTGGLTRFPLELGPPGEAGAESSKFWYLPMPDHSEPFIESGLKGPGDGRPPLFIIILVAIAIKSVLYR